VDGLCFTFALSGQLEGRLDGFHGLVRSPIAPKLMSATLLSFHRRPEVDEAAALPEQAVITVGIVLHGGLGVDDHDRTAGGVEGRPV
jgi:hypothetical protein